VINRWSLFSVDGLARLLLILGLLVVAAGIGFAIAGFSLGWREVIIGILALVGILMVLVPANQVLMLGLYVGVLSIAFGWRTVALTSQLILVPSEVILWILALMLLWRDLIQQKMPHMYMPRSLLVVVLLAFPAILLGISKGNRWDNVVNYAKNLVMIVPVFFVINNLVDSLARWRQVVVVAMFVGTYLALSSLLLVVAPGVGQVLLGDLGAGFANTQGFSRVEVPGWGVFGSLVMAPMIGLGIALWGTAVTVRSKTVYLFILALCGLGVLASGSRGVWVAMLVGMLVYALFYPRRGLILASGLGLLSLTLAQGDILTRLESAFLPELLDSSAADRYFRAQSAVQAIRSSPWVGQGFGSMPFVHSDYLQIGVDMGLPALGCFLLAIGYTIVRLYQLSKTKSPNPVYKRSAEGVLIAFVILIVIFVSGGLLSLPFTIFLAWFLWAIVDRFIQLARYELEHNLGV
jgi:hypothetical protein